MKKFHWSFFTLTLFLLLGAGCSNSKDTSTQTTEAITREQQAYVYCTSKGYVPKIRFDSELNRNHLFCSFENGRECDAIAFLQKQCDPEKVAQEADINVSLSPPESRFLCEPIAKPVCATDSKTYTNRCIAESQGKEVRYEGVCNEQDEPFILEAPPEPQKTTKSSSSSRSSTTQRNTPPPPTTNTTQPSTSQTSGTPEWVNNLTGLLESSASPYGITLSECRSSNALYYYQKEDCTNCFNILYSSTGETLCYPDMNDNECPVWNKTSCKVIWKK